MSASGSGSAQNVSLRPWPAPKKEKLDVIDVLTQVQRLATERGHLRYITEESLQEEIDSGKDSAGDVMEGIEEGEKKNEKAEILTKEERDKQLYAAKSAMMTKVDFARFSAANALNLIALILSRDPAKAVESSFSAQFRHMQIPRGTYGVTKTVDSGKTHKDFQVEHHIAQRDRLASRGSRMKALEQSTDDLLKAATQLETAVRKEVKYWDEVLSISERGWSLQRLVKGSPHSPFAVRYGFREASDHFKSRGLAPLLMDEDGSIILDPKLALQPKTLRVRIRDNGTITGTSSLPVRNSETSTAIEKSTQLARDSLFEEELYHEISTETRQLFAYGVELRDSVIHLSVPTSESIDRKILIDCIPRDTDTTLDPAQSHTNDWIAQNVAEALRILLAHEHHMRLHRRSQKPPPFNAQSLAKRKTKTESPPLLRTVLAFFAHIHHVNALRTYLRRTAHTLHTAALPVALDITLETSWQSLAKLLRHSEREDLRHLDQLLEFFNKPFESIATLSLPSTSDPPADPKTPTQGANVIVIRTRTSLAAPIHGTDYQITLPPSLSSLLHLHPTQHQKPLEFRNSRDVRQYIDWLLTMDIAHGLLGREFTKRGVVRGEDGAFSVKVVEKGKMVGRRDVDVFVEGGELRVVAGKGKDDEGSVWVWRDDGEGEADGLLGKMRAFLEG